MDLDNFYFFTGNSYARKSTMVHLLAQKYDGIECGENYHDNYEGELDPKAVLDNYRKGLELICSQED